MVRTNRNLTAEAAQFAATVRVTEHDVILGVVALFHAHGLGNALLAAVHSGATLVVGSFERDATLAAIEREHVTLFPAVPFIFHTLARTRRAERADLGSLRLCFSAGAPLTGETFDLFLERFGHPVRQLYGCSEAGSVTINLDDDAKGTWDSVGRPMQGIELAVLDEGGLRRVRDADGEILFRSRALTAGYVGHDPAAPDSPFTGGWFRTGDVGRLDDGGNLYVTGRTKLFISTSGYKVDPFEVEAVLRERAGVADVVVVGTSGDHGEEIVKAVVVPTPDADRDQLRDELLVACRQRLAPFKIPRVVEFREAIPRSPLGKILRKYLV
jgi:long-chain acyl-CoA synthetase